MMERDLDPVEGEKRSYEKDLILGLRSLSKRSRV